METLRAIFCLTQLTHLSIGTNSLREQNLPLSALEGLGSLTDLRVLSLALHVSYIRAHARTHTHTPSLAAIVGQIDDIVNVTSFPCVCLRWSLLAPGHIYW